MSKAEREIFKRFLRLNIKKEEIVLKQQII